jgi:hypothetical protein
LGLVEEACGMYDDDKVDQSTVGDVIRTQSKVKINPFPEGQELMIKAHTHGTYFKYINRHSQLILFGQHVKDQPELNIQVDL